MRTIIRFALGAAAMVGFAGAAQAQTSASGLKDGSFETQAGASIATNQFCYIGAGCAVNTPWTAPTYGGVLIGKQNADWPGIQPADGNYFGAVQGGGALSQTFTALQSGTARIVWSDAGRTAGSFNAPHDYDVLFGLAGSDLTNLGRYTTTATGMFNPQKIAGLAGLGIDAGKSYTLTFQGIQGNGDTTSFIDNVSVAVPEAGTWAMMIIGFGAVGSMMRRRRAVRPMLATA